MIFRQLFDEESSTFTYLLADEHKKEAILIDPVFSQTKRDLALVDELGLTLTLVADTHAHADHITAAWLLKQKTGCNIASAKAIGAEHVDVPLGDGQEFGVAGVTLQALSTPGHTDGCMSYLMSDQTMVFTGDALLIRGCGRSDFQQGSAHKLFESITKRLFALPDACRVYPAHDYQGRTQSSIGEEKAFNARRLDEEVKDSPLTESLVDLHIPLDQLRARIGEVPADKPVVALCRSGRRSSMAVNILKENGFEKVASLSRGLLALTRI